jgi:putative endonuclease
MTGAHGANRAKGNRGEEITIEYLLKNGYEILGRNFCIKNNFQGGEIDVIARKNNCVHFIEVKSRASDIFGTGREAVNKKKQETIRRIAKMWLVREKLFDTVDLSFDVADIMSNRLEFLENCF